MHIRPLQPDDAMLIKQLRLRSLADAPYAFGPPPTARAASNAA
jgi:hypothetical protein